MRTPLLLLVGTVGLWSLPPWVAAQVLPPRDDTPLLRIDAGGPVSFVSTVAWARSPGAQHPVLYAAGWDQVVHAWRLEDGRWQYQPASVLRVPVGPGLEVAINSIDVSLDGRRVAVAGRGFMRSASATRAPGLIWPIRSVGADDQLDIGLIYVFDREEGSVRILRGHSGAVSRVKFSPAGNRHLVSYAQHDRQGAAVGNLRVWDVDAGEAGAVLAEQPEHVPGPGVMNGLDVTTTAPGIEGMRVGLVNGTADLLLWDVGRNQASRTPFGPHAYAVTWLAPDRLVSGLVGQLGVWSIPAGPIPKLAQQQNFAARMALPARTTAFTSATGGKVLASVIGGGAGLELHAYDAVTLQRTGARPLWSSSKAPSVAVDPQGEWIAVAGNDTHSIHVYDLRQTRDLSAAPHVLRGAGEVFSQVEFCQREGQPGLRLTPRRPKPDQRDQRVLDLKTSRLESAEGWTPVPPNLAGLVAREETFPDGSKGFAIVRAGRTLWRQPWQAALDGSGTKLRKVTAYALAPATPVYPQPLLAIATLEAGLPELKVVDLGTGETVRHLSGHTERISSLAVSADGKLLASAAEDRTVRIWWLADLNASIGSQGLIRGLEVETRDGGVRIAADEKSRVQAGTELAGVVEAVRGGSRTVPLASAWEFYRYVAETTPGSTLSFQAGPAGNRRLVTLNVDRAIDERKPMLSLFVSDIAIERWVAWDALGKYTERGSEQHIGWHFNWGDPQQPVKYASAAEYREQNLDPDVIRKRIEQGPDLVALPRPEPKAEVMLVAADEESLRHVDGVWVARSRDLRIAATITESPRSVSAVTWQLDDGPQVPCQATQADEWLADLDRGLLTPGVHRLRVRVETNEYPPREISVVSRMRYQPPPPVITALERTKVSAEKAKVEASIAAPVFAEGKSVRITARRMRDGQELQRESWVVEKAGSISWEVTLLPGENMIEWTAVNDSPLASFESEETSRQVTTVERVVPRRPRVEISRVTAGPSDVPVTLTPGQPLKVDQSTLRLRGRIVADDVLEAANFGLAGGKAAPILGYVAGKAELPLDQPITLSPGRQVWRLEVRASCGGEETLQWETDYAPRLPPASDLALKLSETGPDLPDGTALIEGRDPPRVLLTGQLTPPADFLSRKITLTAHVNDRSGEAVDFEPHSQVIPFRLPLDLSPGENVVKLEVKDEWSTARVFTQTLSFDRPPRITSLTAPETASEPFVSVEAQVASPGDPLTRVEIHANGKLAAAIDSREFPGQGVLNCLRQPDGTWMVRARKLAVSAGVTEIRLIAWNSAGASLPVAKLDEGELKSTVSTRWTPPPKRPDAPRIRLSLNNAPQSSPEYKLEFRVQSEVPLTAVRVIYDRQVTSLPLPGEVGRDANFTHLINLRSGSVPVVIQAENAGGQVSERRTINYIEPPSLLTVKTILDRESNQPVPRIKKGADALRFEAAPHGQVRLHGILDRAAPETVFLRVWVNGFLSTTPISRRPVPGRPGATERSFDIDVTLNRSVGNHIELELPGQPLNSTSHVRFQLDCQKPDTNVQLHLVVIGSDKEYSLKPEHIEEALGRRGSPGFKNVQRYLLPEHFNDADIGGVMWRVRGRMQNSENNVLLVCYVGHEVLENREIRLQTRERGLTLRSQRLNSLVVNTRGAHLLFIDSVKAGTSQELKIWPDWPRDDRLGLFRLVWEPGVEHDDRLVATVKRVIASLDSADVRLQLVAAELSKHLRSQPEHAETRVPAAMKDLVLSE